jgi:hypothetical protein
MKKIIMYSGLKKKFEIQKQIILKKKSEEIQKLPFLRGSSVPV